MLTRDPLDELRRMRALPGRSGSRASSSDTPNAWSGSIEATASTSTVVTASGPSSMGSSQLKVRRRASHDDGTSRVTGFDTGLDFTLWLPFSVRAKLARGWAPEGGLVLAAGARTRRFTSASLVDYDLEFL